MEAPAFHAGGYTLVELFLELCNPESYKSYIFVRVCLLGFCHLFATLFCS